jgi:hypothetical protein
MCFRFVCLFVVVVVVVVDDDDDGDDDDDDAGGDDIGFLVFAAAYTMTDVSSPG